jgi:hypothetical protein
VLAAASVIALVSIDRYDGPPEAAVQSVFLVGLPGVDDEAALLHDGDERTPMEIPVRDAGTGVFKIVVTFPTEVDLVDVEVVPSRDESVRIPRPQSAYISETKIYVPVGGDQPAGRGAYGKTKSLQLIVEASPLDPVIQIAELKFWRRDS